MHLDQALLLTNTLHNKKALYKVKFIEMFPYLLSMLMAIKFNFLLETIRENSPVPSENI